ncbi:MAG TPA: hypothetical protein VNU97_05450 [Rhizomicrobium sp.]|jgi:hypothetical protein|nr:hypothetical protein [Rhizomicrobium sp.]
MTNEDTETYGAKVLTWAMIAGAALLFLEVTWSSVGALPQHSVAAPQTATVQVQQDRLARN